MENRELTEKQRKFCDYYIETGNATESAKRAGYSERTARAIGCENLMKPNIARYIEKMNTRLASERIADMTEVKEYWTATMRNVEEETKERTKVSELIARTNGAFIDRVEASIPTEDKLESYFEKLGSAIDGLN